MQSLSFRLQKCLENQGDHLLDANFKKCKVDLLVDLFLFRIINCKDTLSNYEIILYEIFY